jgi:hypothetical protein
MRLFRILATAMAVTLAGSGAFAMFRAADMVVIPSAASTDGLNNSHWHTDLEIMNVDTVAVDVEVVLLECCGTDNSAWYDDIANVLGGRTEDGFGHLDAKLKDIQPGQAVTLTDVVFTNWGANLKGPLLVFAYEASTLMKTTPPGGNPKLIVAQARTYSQDTDANGNPTTYGTQVPGLPWHDYIDPGQKTNGLDKGVFVGLREDASYRSSIGLINISDRLTTISVTLTLNGADGTQIATTDVSLAPLAVEQYDQAIVSLFGKTTADAIAGATLTVSVPIYLTGAQTPAPALMAFVTRMDNVTNDPVYLEQAFTGAFPWDCVFNGNCPPKFTAQGLATRPAVRSHLRPPTRALRK